MDCNEINHPSLLVSLFRSGDEAAKNKIFKCFFRLFYNDFKGFAFNRYSLKEETLIQDAFTDGLVDFYRRLCDHGFQDRGATIKTLFFEFCNRKLLGLLSYKQRESDKTSYMDQEDLEQKATGRTDGTFVSAIENRRELQDDERKLQQAFLTIGERCRKLLIWKKVEKWDNEKIAASLNIAGSSVPNEVYKCFNKLKAIMDTKKT